MTVAIRVIDIVQIVGDERGATITATTVNVDVKDSIDDIRKTLGTLEVLARPTAYAR